MRSFDSGIFAADATLFQTASAAAGLTAARQGTDKADEKKNTARERKNTRRESFVRILMETPPGKRVDARAWKKA